MSDIHDLCDAHLKICCLNLLPAEYFFLLIFALSFTGNSKSGLPPSDVERYAYLLFLSSFYIIWTNIQEGYIINLIYFVTFIVYPSRFIFVVQGAVSLTNISGVSHEMMGRKFIDI